MSNKILIVNTGSDSHKYALYDGETELARMHLEREGETFVAGMLFAGHYEKEKIFAEDYALPLVYVLKHFKDHKIINTESEISAIGVRVVAPGEYFLSHNIIDGEYLVKLKQVGEMAPLHIGPALLEIEQVMKILPGIKVIGCSDSAFHDGLTALSRRYAIPDEDAAAFDIYRYGYHGISVASIARKLESFSAIMPERTVVCHLGSGSSITALMKGKSIDTSMGLTPLEGLPMGSRVGNIDAGAAIALGQKRGMNFAELDNYLNTKCGLLALSGKTKDVRELIELEKAGDERAKLALDTYAYNIKKYIGAYAAALGGLDLIVFTATIGERSNIMRAKICAGLEGLGIILDREKNDKTISADGLIHDEMKSAVKIAVLTTDEMGQIAREMRRFL